MWRARRDTRLALNQAYVSVSTKDKANTNPIDYHYETVKPMWLNLTQVQIQYMWYFLKE